MSAARTDSHRVHGADRARARGVVLVVVMLVIVLAALVGTTVLYFAAAERAATTAGARRTQARALAWSGVLAVKAELWGQRSELLAGAGPRVEIDGLVYEDRATGERGVYRLVAVGGAVGLSAEAGRLDANSAGADMMVRAGLSPGVAAEIVSSRRSMAFSSVPEALSRIAVPDSGALDLRAVLTVFNFDPQVEGAIGGEAGRRRVNVGAPWTKPLAGAIGERVKPEVGAAMRRALGVEDADGRAVSGNRRAGPATMGEWYQRLVAAGLEGEDLARALDVSAVGDGEYRVGAVSVLEAPATVLEAVPGFTAESAGKALAVRQHLTWEERGSLLWLVQRDVLTAEAFAEAVDYLSARCLQWRVAVEGGVVSDRAERVDGRSLRERVVLEAVIDVSGPEARIAYLRDITWLDAQVWLDARGAAMMDASEAEALPETPAADPSETHRGEGSPAPATDPTVRSRAPAERRAAPGGRVGRWTTGGG